MVIRGGTIVNIAGTTPVDDPEYRYKMPAVFGKIEGSGNGIKTAIPNISDVASSLHRQPGEVNKFFGTELGAQTRYNADTDRAIVNGAHTDAVLQDLVHRYIEKFVLCPNCGLPETKYKIKSDVIYHSCAACGAKEMVDMSHKLCNYILAENKKSKKEKGKDKKSKKEKEKDDDSEGKKKKKDKKPKKDKKKDKKGKEESKSQEKKDDDFEEEDDDDSSEPTEVVDDEGAMQLAVDATKQYLQDNPGVSDADLAEYVTNQQMASALKTQDKLRILLRSAFTADFFKNKEVEKYAPVIARMTNSNRIMERHLIAALESHCMSKPKTFPVMLKQLYDEDALEEETILEWADDGRTDFTLASVDEDARSTLRGEAEPVVVWLQEAESDESDED